MWYDESQRAFLRGILTYGIGIPLTLILARRLMQLRSGRGIQRVLGAILGLLAISPFVPFLFIHGQAYSLFHFILASTPAIATLAGLMAGLFIGTFLLYLLSFWNPNYAYISSAFLLPNIFVLPITVIILIMRYLGNEVVDGISFVGGLWFMWYPILSLVALFLYLFALKFVARELLWKRLRKLHDRMWAGH